MRQSKFTEVFMTNIYTVNFHIETRCNLKCRFCYANFAEIKDNDRLSLNDSYRLIDLLKKANCIKINFAGGEPFLYSHLGEMIQYAYNAGLKTSIVTNGTLLKNQWLNIYGRYLHWITISCDSAQEKIQKQLGRGTGQHVATTQKAFQYINHFNQVNGHRHRIRTKLNSVVTSLNWQEDMSSFISQCEVERWKILQILRIQGENEESYSELAINSEQFMSFVKRHECLKEKGIVIVDEDNDAMTESYIMIDPQGCFYQNSNNKYIKSSPILQIGVTDALQQVGFCEKRFMERGGFYKY